MPIATEAASDERMFDCDVPRFVRTYSATLAVRMPIAAGNIMCRITPFNSPTGSCANNPVNAEDPSLIPAGVIRNIESFAPYAFNAEPLNAQRPQHRSVSLRRHILLLRHFWILSPHRRLQARRIRPDAARASPSRFQALQLPDQPLDDTKPALPKRRVARIEAERRQQLGMMLGAAGRQHGEITLGKTFGRILVDGVERIHQAI